MFAILDEVLLEEAIQIGVNCASVQPAIKYLQENSNVNICKQYTKNIKYLSKNYKKIKMYCERRPNLREFKCVLAEFKNTEIVYCFCEENLTLEKFMKLRSPIIHEIFNHFNLILDLYNEQLLTFKKDDFKRRYSIYYELYICDSEIWSEDNYIGDKYDWVSEKYHINKRTIYKDLDKVYLDLAMLYYGNIFD